MSRQVFEHWEKAPRHQVEKRFAERHLLNKNSVDRHIQHGYIKKTFG